ncbi:MAG: SPOR domain-containing protein [Rubricella sp.]
MFLKLALFRHNPVQCCKEEGKRGLKMKRHAMALAIGLAHLVATPAVADATYVQVAAFAVPQNAERLQDRLSATGLPVSTRSGRMRGQAVTLVRVGPFPTEESAQTALGIVRAAGFSDAFFVTD